MARALLLTAAALGTLAASVAEAQPGPYAAGDRYGPVAPSASVPYGYGASAPQSVAPLRGRTLVWPGKVDRAAGGAPQARPDAAAGWTGAPPPRMAYVRPQGPTQAQADRAFAELPRASTPSPRDAAYARVPQPSVRSEPPARALVGAPTQGWRPVVVAGAPALAATRAPVYAPAFAPPPNRAMAADRRYGYDPTQDHAVRVYSVARPFGLRPDPAPIPPQFFTATADLSGGDPPGPLPVNHTTAAARAAVVGGSDAGSQ